MKKLFSHKSGFTLLETLVAVFIFSVALISLVSVTSQGISGSRGAILQTEAQYLAQEAMESVRYIRDSEFLGGTTGTAFLSGGALAQCIGNECGVTAIPLSGGDFPELSPCLTRADCVVGQDAVGIYGSYGGAATDESPFYRSIELIATPNPDVYVVKVKVTWNQGTIPRSITISDVITNWYQLTQ